MQTDSVIPSVSPLNLNLLAPHGRSQPCMGLCFASKSRCLVLSEYFIETKFDVSVFNFPYVWIQQLIIQLLLFMLKSC